MENYERWLKFSGISEIYLNNFLNPLKDEISQLNDGLTLANIFEEDGDDKVTMEKDLAFLKESLEMIDSDLMREQFLKMVWEEIETGYEPLELEILLQQLEQSYKLKTIMEASVSKFSDMVVAARTEKQGE